MSRPYRPVWLLPLLAVAGMLFSGDPPRHAHAQMPAEFGAGSRFELDDAVQIDRVDNPVLAQLQRVKAYLADRQWDEALDTLAQVMENSEDKLLPVSEQRHDRFVSLRQYGHLQLAALPAEALKRYRSRVDPAARKWYEQGVKNRDRGLLLKVVEQAFASSWGDDALLALGAVALESGDYAAARWHFERIVPQPEAPRTWPGYPDTELDLAAVRARLVLVSILEGSRDRARDELTQLIRLHPDARGRLGGPEVDYAEALRGLLAQSSAWPPPEPDPDWPTFAGNTLRSKVVPEMVDPGGVAWRIPLPEIATLEPDALISPADRQSAAKVRLSYHPVLVGNLVLVNTQREILAVDVATGRPAWGEAGPAVYRAPLEGIAGAPSRPSFTLGVPRCTMTVFDGKLYARMGTPVTSMPPQVTEEIRPGYLVCLDLAAEGRLMWSITPEAGWALEGSPVVDGANVYVAMRRNDIRPQAHVACFDAQTGRRRWRRFVCSAETPARGMLYQNTHNLLTLRRETIYYNTNLGAVAAISARDGRTKWVSLYPRARRGSLAKLAPHWRRDLNPCLYHRGTLIVAPADSPRIFALDAANGQILWQSGPEVDDVRYLLGTTAEHLIAGGEKLYWIGIQGEEAGRLKHVWPDGVEKLGHGRGVIAGHGVLWPTREKIYVFDPQTAQPKKVIDLARHGITGGNLLVAGRRLLIATGKELIALSPHVLNRNHRKLTDAPRR